MTNRRTLCTKTDKELLNRHVAGDKEAFDVLYERHHDRLQAVATTIVGNDAEDAVQDAMISAYCKADQYHGDSKVTTWLHRIVVNAALDIVRRKPLVAQGDEPSYQPWRIERATKRMDIGKHLHRLTPAQRACLLLVDMMGYTVAEAAKILGISEGTLKSRCARGRHRLADRLHGYREASLPA